MKTYHTLMTRYPHFATEWLKCIYFLFFTIVATFTTYGQITVSGKVTDKSGGILLGVTIVEKGTNNGAVTNIDGSYALSVEDRNSVLIFSYIGFITDSISVGSKQVIDVILEEELGELGEVVVIGYQSVNKSDVTGSISNIKTESLSEIPSNSIEEVLAGRVAGLVISDASDAPGAGVNVRIRGASSFTATTPLVVVDGFPLGDAGNLKQINPTDVVSVEVLKDASAASIYGSRGANGVILVTTRRGKKGDPQIVFTSLTSFNRFSSKFNIYENPLILATLTDEDRVNSGLLPVYIGDVDVNGTFFPSLEQIQSGYPITNYVDFVFRNPVNQNYNLSVTGGSDRTRYNFGFNYNTQNGITRNDDLSKTTANFGIIQNIDPSVELSTNLIFSRGIRIDNSGLSFDRNITFPLLNQDESFFKANDNDFGNPSALDQLRVNESTTLDLTSSSYLKWNILEDLEFKTQFNYSLGSSIQERFFPNTYTQLGTEGNGVAFIDNFQNQRMVADGYFTYYGYPNQNHSFSILAGYSTEYFEQRTSQLKSEDFVNSSLGAGNLSGGNEQNTSNDLFSRTLSSFISRLNYSYKDKILITYTGRVDGSSNFGTENRFAFFPSGAISWKIHNESFLSSYKSINQLKVRLSWGLTGNQAISPFETLNRLGQGRYFTNGGFVVTAGPTQLVNNGIFAESFGLGNPALKWETTEILNLGLDFSVLSDKIQLTLDFYEKITNDLLVNSRLPPTSGFDFLRINAGEIENKGFEISINYQALEKGDLGLNLGLVLNRNRNKVIGLGPADLTNVLSDEFGNQFRFTGTNFREQYRGQINVNAIGQPINVFYGAKVVKVLQTEEEGLANGLSGPEAQPGEFLYADLNGDGVIDETSSDRTIIGDPNPDFTSGLTIDFTYKNWELNVLFNGSFGGDIVNVNKFSTQAGGGQVSNLIQRWTVDNPSEEFPRLRQTRNVAFSDWWIQDGSFVRIQNVRLGYNFNVSKLDFIQGAKVFISGDNLHTFTKYDGLDPEVGIDGIDQNRIPRLRRYSLGLRLTF